MPITEPSVYIIAFEVDTDGHVAIMEFVTQLRDGGTFREASNEALLAEIAKAGFSAQSYITIDDPMSLPNQNVSPMDTWRIVNGQIVVV
jgi:hypothetical protein